MRELASITEKEKSLLLSFLNDGRKIANGLTIRWAERIDLGANNHALRIGVALPENINIDSDEAFILHDLAVTMSSVENSDICISLTGVAGEGELLSLESMPADAISKKAVIVYRKSNLPAEQAPKEKDRIQFLFNCLTALALLFVVGLLTFPKLVGNEQVEGAKGSIGPEPTAVRHTGEKAIELAKKYLSELEQERKLKPAAQVRDAISKLEESLEATK